MAELAVRTPTQARAVRTRAALLRAAREEFSRVGHAKTTARSVAKRARVAVGTFYQYFPDKDALLRELSKERLTRIGERTVGAIASEPSRSAASTPARPSFEVVRRRMRGVVEAVVDHHREDPGLHAVLTERRHADPELDAMTSAAEKALVERVAWLLERWSHEGDVLATAFVIFGMVEGAVHAHVLGEPMVSDERFYDALVDAVVRVARPDTSKNGSKETKR